MNISPTVAVTAVGAAAAFLWLRKRTEPFYWPEDDGVPSGSFGATEVDYMTGGADRTPMVIASIERDRNSIQAERARQDAEYRMMQNAQDSRRLWATLYTTHVLKQYFTPDGGAPSPFVGALTAQTNALATRMTDSIQAMSDRNVQQMRDLYAMGVPAPSGASPPKPSA
jgi:hypothetical protein